MQGHQSSCAKDCPRRKVGCRADCPQWQEHERRKAQRYADTQRRAAAFPAYRRGSQTDRRNKLDQLKR